MKPVQQLRRNENGDCLRACIASLLDLDAEQVPDFAEINPKEVLNGWPKWWLELQSWLMHRGLFFLEVTLDQRTPWRPLPFQGYCMFVGTTKSGHRHMTVGLVGDNETGEQFVQLHDPFHHAGGFEAIDGVCFLVPLNPAHPMPLSEAKMIITPENAGAKENPNGSIIIP